MSDDWLLVNRPKDVCIIKTKVAPFLACKVEDVGIKSLLSNPKHFADYGTRVVVRNIDI